MGTTLTFGKLHEAVKADWINDEIMTKHRDLSNFSTADRVRALRASAEWCRAGAPGGSTRRLFSPEGPCALGHALLGLHEFPGDWVATTAGVGDAGAALLGTDLSDPRLTRASMWLAEVAAAFDSGHLEAAAWRLDKAADMLLAVEREPQGELSDEDMIEGPIASDEMAAALNQTFNGPISVLVEKDLKPFEKVDWPSCWKEPGEYLQTWEPVTSERRSAHAELVPA